MKTDGEFGRIHRAGKRSLVRIVTLLALAIAMPAQALAPNNADARLPDYRAQAPVSGVIRVWGSDHMGDLMKYWQADFRKLHPNVWFENNLKGTASAQFGLHMNVADIALSGRQVFPYEYYGIYRRSQLLTVEVPVATGSYDVRGKSTAIGIFVHKDNPLTKLTLEQLDGIYGDQRTGGWQRMEWITAVARGPAKNIRTWGQLGVKGKWANKPIHVYGPPGLHPGGVSFFQSRVMGGADTWNEALQEFGDRKAMMKALSEDPYGIAYTSLPNSNQGVKPLALAEDAAQPYIALSRENVADRSYPLSRFAYLYFAPDTVTGDAARTDPKILEFIRFILSSQGRRAFEPEGDYSPLPVAVAVEQLKKLD